MVLMIFIKGLNKACKRDLSLPDISNEVVNADENKSNYLQFNKKFLESIKLPDLKNKVIYMKLYSSLYIIIYYFIASKFQVK